MRKVKVIKQLDVLFQCVSCCIFEQVDELISSVYMET